ncbi:hypothetical protein PFISCL1PPCAC_7360, partial [Pristionchus fissidentatus]
IANLPEADRSMVYTKYEKKLESIMINTYPYNIMNNSNPHRLHSGAPARHSPHRHRLEQSAIPRRQRTRRLLLLRKAGVVADCVRAAGKGSQQRCQAAGTAWPRTASGGFSSLYCRRGQRALQPILENSRCSSRVQSVVCGADSPRTNRKSTRGPRKIAAPRGCSNW